MIGIFDSGIGGLTALSALCAQMPEEDYLYFADTAHLPYGARTDGDIRRYTAAALSFLKAQGASCVLLACGTASAVALDFCKRSFTFPIYDVLEPSVLAAIQATKSRRVGVAATEATVRSGVLERLFRKYDPTCEVTLIPCPTLVELIESGERCDTRCYDAVCNALMPLKRAKIDTLILGCTHFAWLRTAIAAFLPSVTLIESGKEAADALISARRQPKAPTRGISRVGRVRFFTTASAAEFSARASARLGRKVKAKEIYRDII